MRGNLLAMNDLFDTIGGIGEQALRHGPGAMVLADVLDGAERKCRCGLLTTAYKGIPETLCSSRAFLTVTLGIRPCVGRKVVGRLPEQRLPGYGRFRAGEWNLRAIPQDRAQRILPCRIPQKGVPFNELQADLDVWVREYNEERPHQGRWCFGKRPMQTFLDAMPMAKEKMIAA